MDNKKRKKIGMFIGSAILEQFYLFWGLANAPIPANPIAHNITRTATVPRNLVISIHKKVFWRTGLSINSREIFAGGVFG
jgi:hypothetical protein